MEGSITSVGTPLIFSSSMSWTFIREKSTVECIRVPSRSSTTAPMGRPKYIWPMTWEMASSYLSAVVNALFDMASISGRRSSN